MDDDGSNVEHIGHLNLGAALHPVMLKDGRVMFSSLETQGLRSDERWGIWAIRPDGTQLGATDQRARSPPGQAVHFQAQLADESIVVESYYQTGSTDGFGTFWKFPLHAPEGYANFGSGLKQFVPQGLINLTLFASFSDVRPNHQGSSVDNKPFIGNVTHPAAAPDNHMLLVWSLPWEAQDQSSQGLRRRHLSAPIGPGDQSSVENAADQERSEVSGTVASRAGAVPAHFRCRRAAPFRSPERWTGIDSSARPARRSGWSALPACTSVKAIRPESCPRAV